MIVLIIARSNNFVNYRATLSIKDESEFAYILFSCIQGSCLLLNTQLNAETDRHIVQSFGLSLQSHPLFRYTLYLFNIFFCVSHVCSYSNMSGHVSFPEFGIHSLSCPVYTYYLTMKGDTRGGRTITKFPSPSHIFSSEPPQNPRPFKYMFLSVSNP